jgi:hypothetical protein
MNTSCRKEGWFPSSLGEWEYEAKHFMRERIYFAVLETVRIEINLVVAFCSEFDL